MKPFQKPFTRQFAAIFNAVKPGDEMPKKCPECGTPDIRSVGNTVQLRCKCRSVEAASGAVAVRLWNEEGL
jgi:hypothetical protein